MIQKVFIRNVSLRFYAKSKCKFCLCFEVYIPVLSKFVREWNQLNVSTRSAQAIPEYQTKPLITIGPFKKSKFNIIDLKGIKLLTRLRVEFSDLRFTGSGIISTVIMFLVICQTGTEDNEHFLMHYPRFTFHSRHFLQLVCRLIGVNFTRLSSNELINLLFNGYQDLDVVVNRIFIEATLKYIKITGQH